MQVFFSKHGPMGKLFISMHFKPAFLMMEATEELDVVYSIIKSNSVSVYGVPKGVGYCVKTR